MRSIAIAAATAMAASTVHADTLVKLESKFGVQETIERLSASLETKGIKVAARIDHAAAAKAAGMELPPTQVVLFGNPKLGTPLMQSNPEIGIDLPLRILAWQDKAGKVWVGYTAPEVMKGRYGITDRDEIFSTMRAALTGLTRDAGGQ